MPRRRNKGGETHELEGPDIDGMRRRRSALKGWVVRCSNRVDEVLKGEAVDASLLRVVTDDLSVKLKGFDEFQLEFECAVPDADVERVIEEAAVVRDDALSLLAKAEQKYKALGEQNVEKGPAEKKLLKEDRETRESSVELPKIELPQFSGNILEWVTFWEQFSAIVLQSKMPDISKFTYLLSSLKGEARRCIEGIPLTASNFNVACELLEKRYGKAERIIYAHVQALMRIDFSKPRDACNELFAHVRCLENLGISPDQYGVILTPMVVSKLPGHMRLDWARQCEGKESNLGFLMNFVLAEVEKIERSETYKAPAVNQGKKPGERRNDRGERRNDRGEHRGLPTASALTSDGKPKCELCEKVHRTENCFAFLKLSVPERWQKVKTSGICFVCLKRGHFADKCSGKCSRCNGRHHELCCSAEQTQVKEVSAALASKTQDYSTCYQIAEAFCGKRKINILFDSGSDRSYVSSNIVRFVRPRFMGRQELKVCSFGGSAVPLSADTYELKLKTRHSGTVVLRALEVPQICSPLRRCKLLPEDLLPLSVSDLAAEPNTLMSSIDVLIGLDQYWDLVGSHQMRVDNGLMAQRSAFGWLLSGKVGSSAGDGLVSHQLFTEGCIRKFWDLDSLGVVAAEEEADSELTKKFQDELTYKDGRYEASLLWKENSRELLLDNEPTARRCLNSLCRRLDREPELKAGYEQALREMEQMGFVEEVPKDDAGAAPVFYLPHHPVVRGESTTTKIRPVFNASFKGVNGVSLNDCLHPGPSLNPDLTEVLLRFRRWPFVVTADVTKAFLQIGLHPRDRDVHRFLMRDGDTIRKMRFLRVTFGVSCSPFMLNATVRHHLKLYSENTVVDELNCNLYVDDWLSGADSEAAAFQLFEQAQKIMDSAGMKLAKWSSNSAVVCDKIGVALGENTTKLLGVVWSPKEDCFSFRAFPVPSDVVFTKRIVLSYLARCFDPIGFLSPVIMFAKCLFQKLWALGIEWDAELSPEQSSQFMDWLNSLKLLENWNIPRQFVSGSWCIVAQECCLHVFADASERGYGAAVYLVVGSKGTRESSLVFSRARIAPLKRITLPRLELMACLVACRVLKYVMRALKMDGALYRCWTDSTIALSWIQGEASKWKPFVSNRVREIQESTDPALWKHCKSADNPADLLSRGVLAAALIRSPLWLSGPEWLVTGTYPKSCSTPPRSGEVEVEYRVVLVSGADPVNVLPVQRWSSFRKAVRVTAWVRRFIDNSLQLVWRGGDRMTGGLTQVELLEAERVLICSIQAEAFKSDVAAVKAGRALRPGSPLQKLTPMIDEHGMLRIRGRLQEANMSYSARHPIILPKGHAAAILARDVHLRLGHGGVDSTLTELRRTYWIIGGRRILKSIKRSCAVCQRQDSQPIDAPSGPLPADRVTGKAPFDCMGVDFAGPLLCADTPGVKHYIMLFSCAVTRAVHLELTSSLTSEEALLAFRRFCARRMCPSVVYSDNARTFQRLADMLVECMGSDAPRWKFIAPRAPWWGGFWERMVRSVKTNLKKTLGRRCLSRAELETVLFEVESCINSRPITFVGDCVDGVEPLTPAHFLHGGRPSGDGSLESPVQVRSEELHGLRAVQSKLADMFWKRWSQDYLTTLPKQGSKGKVRGEPKVGLVVLVREDGLPRMKWRMGVIEELLPGRDGQVRCVRLRTSTGRVVRPVQRLHSLEVLSCPEIVDDSVDSDGDDPVPVTPSIHDSCVQKTRSGRVVKVPSRPDL